jgi:hypothetical protein
MQELWELTRRDNLRLKLHLASLPTSGDAIFVLAVHTKYQDASLIEVKTKNVESAARVVLDNYHTFRPDEHQPA